MFEAELLTVFGVFSYLFALVGIICFGTLFIYYMFRLFSVPIYPIDLGAALSKQSFESLEI